MTAKLIAALAKALPEIGAVAKNKENAGFKTNGKASKYADLAAMIEALEPIRAHGLWYRQHSHESAEGVSVETFYLHESGEQLSAGTLFMPASKRDAHGFGSALTYARRYALQTAFGVATEDDDGAAQAQPMPAALPEMPDAEFSKLVSLMKATGTSPGPIVKHYGVANVRQLNLDQYADALASLETKLAKLVKVETARTLAEELSDVIPD